MAQSYGIHWNTFPLSGLLHPWLPLFYRFLDLGALREVDLSGVATANSNNKDAQAKGIKAFFNMDDSGILNLDKVWQRFHNRSIVSKWYLSSSLCLCWHVLLETLRKKISSLITVFFHFVKHQET